MDFHTALTFVLVALAVGSLGGWASGKAHERAARIRRRVGRPE